MITFAKLKTHSNFSNTNSANGKANADVRNILRGRVQPKLKVGSINDPAESEADRVADQVMRMPARALETPTIASAKSTADLQRKCADCNEEEVQRKEVPQIRMKASGGDGAGSPASAEASSAINSLGSGSPLSSNERVFFEPRFGRDLSNLRIHTGGTANAASQAINARAFSLGNNIAFAQGEYKPGTQSGRLLMAHEITHALQGGGQVNRVIRRKCDASLAIPYNKNKHNWTAGLIEEMYKVTGPSGKPLYVAALQSGTIDEHFVALACATQKALGFTGDSVDGKLGKGTTTAWETWKTGGKHGINYNRLIDDGKIHITLALGHESFDRKFEGVQAFLIQEGFTITKNSANQTYVAKASRMQKVQGDNNAAPVRVDFIVEIFSEYSTTPEARFAQSLSTGEVVIYAGHARYGTGPDFDEKESQSENFVIGKGYDSKMNQRLKGEKNDLEKMSQADKFDMQSYQLWAFAACSSQNYQDELRDGKVGDSKGNSKSAENLRLVMSKHPTWSGVSSPIPIIQGLLERKTMPQIVDHMDRQQVDFINGHKKDPGYKKYFLAD